MRTEPQTKTKALPTAAAATPIRRLLQRKCACGGSASLSGNCQECQDKRFTLYRSAVDRGAFSGPERSFAASSGHGATGTTHDPQTILAQLDSGQPFSGGPRSRMESVFQRDFSQVRIHTDSNAARLSQHFNAQAFTIGNHIAFASGQYRPGAMIGDALLAHELAHVSQQSQAGASAVAMQAGGAEYDSLERDADVSAAHAVVSLWGRAKAMASGLAQHVAPRLKSGLRMSMYSCFGASYEGDQKKDLNCDQICEWADKEPSFNEGFGAVVCYYGKKCPCIFYNRYTDPSLDIPVNLKLGECPKLDEIVRIHEERHINDADCDSSRIHLLGTTDPVKAKTVECAHRAESVKLLDEAIKTLDDSDPCKAKMTTVRHARDKWEKDNCG